MKLQILPIIIGVMTLHCNLLFSQYTYDWAVKHGGSNTDYAYGVAVDNDGNVISGGEFRYTIDFDPSEDGEALLTAVDLNNGYVCKLNAEGEYVWAHPIEGNSRVLDVHTDDEGNVYACGRFRDTIDVFYGEEEWLLSSNGDYDAFLIKYTTAGELVWAFSLGGIYQDFMNNITVDVNDNLIVCGEFTNTVDFDSGSGEGLLVGESDTNAWDTFVAKYNSDGSYIWARQFSGESLQNGAGVSSTSEGDIVVAGHFTGITDLDPGPGEQLFENDGEIDWQGYAVKLSEAGELIWAKSFGSVNHEWLYGMAVDEQDNVYVTGAFNGTPDFDPGEGVFEMTAEGFTNDPYILKLDSNGDFVWAIQYASASDGGCYAIDVIQGAIYSVGYASGTCDFDPGVNVNNESSGAAGYYGFVAVLDTEGQYLWSDRIGNGADDFTYAVVADEEFIYTAGSFRGTSVWFGTSTFFNSSGLDDAFIAKIQHPIVDQVTISLSTPFIIYPNPTNDFITISGVSGTSNLIIVNVTGKIVMRENIVNNMTINLSPLDAGIYTLMISMGDEINHQNIVIVK